MAVQQQTSSLIDQLADLNIKGEISQTHLAAYARQEAVKELLAHWETALNEGHNPSVLFGDIDEVIRSLEEFREAARPLMTGSGNAPKHDPASVATAASAKTVAEHHPANGGGQVTIDLAHFPHLVESTTGLWPFDQQTQFAAAVSQLSRALPKWIPDLKDTVLKERLARGFAYQALYGIRRKMNNHGHIPDADMIDEIQRMEQTQGRHPT